MGQITYARLGDIADFVRGVTFKPEEVVPADSIGSVRCMRTKNVQVELDTSDVLTISSSVVKRPIQYLQQGDTLVSSANSWNLVGKCCWIPNLDWPSTFGGFVSVLRADTSILDKRYLFHWFSSPDIQRRLRTFGRKTTSISNLDIGRCKEIAVPLPALDRQRRIARVLDAADALRAKRREAISRLESLAESIFVEIFGDPKHNPHHWQVVSLADVATTTSGGTPSRRDDGNYNGSIPWVKSGELDVDIVLDTEEKITSTGLASSSAKLMPENTILMAMYGATVGAVAILGIQAATNQAICCIQFGSDIQREYLVTFLRIIKPFLLSRRAGGAQPNLSQSMIREIRLPLPPKDLQREFEMRKKVARALIGRQNVSLAHFDALFASLQDRAFKGEL